MKVKQSPFYIKFYIGMVDLISKTNTLYATFWGHLSSGLLRYS